MKSLIRIIVLTLIAIVIQQSIFLYIENIYLNSSKEIVVQKIEEEEDTSGQNIKTITLGNNIENAEVSDSGKYAWYMKDDKITILDVKNDTEKQIECNDKIVYCKWKTNEDSLIIFKEVNNGKNRYYEMMPYNAKKNEAKDDLADFDRNESRINLTSSDTKLDKVAYSPLSGTMYIKILKDDDKSDLYYLNVENNINRVRKNIDLDDIVLPSNANKCVMIMNGKVTVLDSDNNIEIPNSTDVKILGADLNSNVYFGEVVNKKISKIYFKNINDNNSSWTTISMSKDVKEDDIVINTDGTIFVNDDTAKTVTDLINNKSLVYEGEFMQGIKDGFVTKEGNVLTLNYFKDLTKSK